MDKILRKIEDIFTSVLLLIITALLFINVILRIFGLSIDWAEEFSRYSIIWITFVGGSICIYKGAHIGIDSITALLSKRGKNILSVFTIIMAILFTSIFIVKTFNLVRVVYITGQLSSTLEVPMWIVYGAMPVGGVLMLIRFIQELVKQIKVVKKGDD